jgi:CRP/FNR family transcriptional regulator
MKKVVNILARTFLFRGLPWDQLEKIAQIAIEKTFNKGESIFSEGDEGHGFYVVAEGLVKIFKTSTEGKEHILHIFGSGEPCGAVPVFAGQQFPASAEAISETRTLFFSRSAFYALISRSPSLALNMLAVLSMRLREFTVKIENLSLKEIPGRLAAYLLHLATEQNSEDSVLLSISKGQLASLLGTTPETLSRSLARMSEESLIEVSGRSIRLLDRSELWDLAERGN